MYLSIDILYDLKYINISWISWPFRLQSRKKKILFFLKVARKKRKTYFSHIFQHKQHILFSCVAFFSNLTNCLSIRKFHIVSSVTRLVTFDRYVVTHYLLGFKNTIFSYINKKKKLSMCNTDTI